MSQEPLNEQEKIVANIAKLIITDVDNLSSKATEQRAAILRIKREAKLLLTLIESGRFKITSTL
jgi:hypothetical protein